MTQARTAAEHAHSLGIDFNLDLMFGLPEQSMRQALDDVETAIHLRPSHISSYQLTIEPNTAFYLNPPSQPTNDALFSMQTEIQSRLAASEFEQYEVSAYAQYGKRCRHNLNYWQFGDYLGIGAGAHGKLTHLNGDVVRYWKQKHPSRYVENCEAGEKIIGGKTDVAVEQLQFEFMLNALRLTQGFDSNLFESRTRLSISSLSEKLNKHKEMGLLTYQSGRIIPTERGRSMIDSMLQDYLPD